MKDQTAGDRPADDIATGHSSDGQPQRPKLSRGRRWAFRFILIVVIPLLLLTLTEVGLRVAGCGYPTSFLIRIPGADAYTTNPQFGRRFFSRALNRAPLPPHLPAEKGPRTYRIFIFGGSAAQGVPDPSVGFGRVLEVMLEQSYPDARFEVVNTAMTAVNSHVVLPIARECARFSPDLFIVYMGNNEVTGPYGTGTVFAGGTVSLGMIRAQLAMKTMRLGQVVDGIARRSGRRKSPAYWGGLEMFLDNQVAFDDPRLQTTYEHLRGNLSDICRAARDGGADVIVSTVAVNLVDCPPFASASHEGAGDEGAALQLKGDMPGAIGAYQRALQTHPGSAELFYRLGQCYLATGQADEAATAFVAARDRDLLRFRADSNINRVIRDVADTWRDRGVLLVDAERQLGRVGQVALPGEDLFYEHVHLTSEGNYQLARLMFPVVVERLPQSIRSGAAVPAPPSKSDCLARLALTPWQRLQILSYIVSMMERPPFTSQLGNDQRRERWQGRLDRLQLSLTPEAVATMAEQYRAAIKLAEDDLPLRTNFLQFLQFAGNLPEARVHAQRLLEALPTNAAAHFEMGMVCYGLGDVTTAQTHFQRTEELAADRAGATAKIAEFMFRNQQLDEAERLCRKSLELQPDSPKMLQAIGWIHLARGEWSEAMEPLAKALELRPGDAQMHQDLGVAHRGLGQQARAMEQFRRALELDPSLLTARKHYADGLARAGRLQEAIGQFASAVEQMPEDVPLRGEYAMLLVSTGADAEAIVQFREISRRRPDSISAMNQLTWLLATSPDLAVRDASEALRVATQAAEQTQYARPDVLDMLALALAEQGRFDEAVETLQRAIDLLNAGGPPQLLRQCEARKALYEAGGRVSEQRKR